MKNELVPKQPGTMQAVFSGLTTQQLNDKLNELTQKANKLVTKFPDFTYEVQIISDVAEESDEQDTCTLVFTVREKTQEELNKDYGTY